MSIRKFHIISLGFVGALALRSPDMRASTGGELFVRNCAPCHGSDGRAQTPAAKKLGVKDLSLSKLADEAIERQLLEGKKNDRGAIVMPAFREKLSPEEIQALVAFVKSLRP